MSTVSARALNAKTETYPLLTVAQIDPLRTVRTGREALRGRSLVSPGRCRGAGVSLAIGVLGD
jgi:hypothetical protein